MWCHHCQQDVPAVAQAANDPVRCARCQRSLAEANFAAPVNDAGVRLDATQESGEPVTVEAWKADEVISSADEQRLRQIRRQLQSSRGHAAGAQPGRQQLRFDLPTPEIDTTAPAPRQTTSQRPAPTPQAPAKSGQATAWFVALIGALAVGAGIGLLGWSLLGERPDLWTWGLGTTLAGQGLMIVGLLQLLGSLWTAGRDATNRLVTLHYEIRRLQRTADSLAGMRNAAPSTFYADLSRGSSPQVLLSNLKGQLDEMNTRMAND